MDEIKLEAKLVGDIQGVFNVPSYQRGYRWGKEEVERLLNDIYGIYDDETKVARNYCLQPIVVKRNGDTYDLIDGQQRLTTIYLIYKYMSVVSNGWVVKGPKFSLQYETRSDSKEFLENIDINRREENIDFWFIANAYETISNWFNNTDGELSVIMNHMITYLTENVKIIWYEVNDSEDSIALFERLNIGKIALTSAELVKAMFLSSAGNEEMDREKQEEIALQWDNMEKELHNESLWYFLTNNSGQSYQTRIDLILDLIAKKNRTSKDKYFTFFAFDSMSKNRSLKSIWTEIMHTFLVLKDWYGNHELYHKVGYLIASKSMTLDEIFYSSQDLTKRQFLGKLDEFIKNSIKIEKNYGELSYDRPYEYAEIFKLLLLFNVESVRKNGEKTQWFPFDKFKFVDNGSVVWSLEHIHAQQSEGMKTQEEWREWLLLHLESVESIGNQDLAKKISEMLNNKKIIGGEFEAIQNEVFEALSVKGNVEYLHSISNLALLNSSNNAALSNSTFDVKRNEIIRMDKRGEFIPFCTKMVFLKYYTPSEQNQLHFWGQTDREAYVGAINEILKNYLDEEITIEKGDDE